MARPIDARNRFGSRARRRSPPFPLLVLSCAVAGFIVAYGIQMLPGLPGLMNRVASAPALEIPFSGSGPIEEGFMLGRIDRHMPLCVTSGASTCVIDGDTIKIEGTSIRIADIDTPEVFSPSCPAEARLGDRASMRMAELLNRGGFVLRSHGTRDEDRYGRKLRVVERDGQSVGMMLVAEGLAHEWGGPDRGWC